MVNTYWLLGTVVAPEGNGMNKTDDSDIRKLSLGTIYITEFCKGTNNHC